MDRCEDIVIKSGEVDYRGVRITYKGTANGDSRRFCWNLALELYSEYDETRIFSFGLNFGFKTPRARQSGEWKWSTLVKGLLEHLNQKNDIKFEFLAPKTPGYIFSDKKFEYLQFC